MSTERRTLVQPVEFRSAGDRQIVAAGYAAVFGKRSHNLGGFVEDIHPTAFNKTVREADVAALFNHDPNRLLGRSSAGTLRLEVDEVGLAYQIDLPDTSDGRDVAVLLERGDLSGSSFGFRVIADEWGLTEDEFPLRTLRQVALRDVGPVAFPAYPDTEAALRSLASDLNVELAEVRALAEANDLRQLLAASSAPELATDAADEEEEGRVAPTFHLHARRAAHLL